MDVPVTERAVPRINDPAPQFEATSTQGPIKLSDFQGKWVVLFSHPADFTPVCSTEFAAFSRRWGDFDRRDVQLIGISVDSVQSHLAWIDNINSKLNVDVPFPVIADLDTRVSQLYGMIHPGASATATVRCVFFIDPKQVIRAIIYYPMQVGRSMDEILRVVDALQLVDGKSVSTPADWQPGEPVVVPAPSTVEALKKRKSGQDEGLNVTEWYLSTRQL
jgi:peroxiredoxin (alkyl hydroperoxide reductase subunit C)